MFFFIDIYIYMYVNLATHVVSKHFGFLLVQSTIYYIQSQSVLITAQ